MSECCEKSCGAVVFTRLNGEIKYVIIQSLAGYYGFPKGHMEAGESEKQTALREVYEETGLTLTNWQCRGVVTFLLEEDDGIFGEFMYLFTADGWEGTRKECDEGDLQWVSRAFLDSLPTWEGDKIFLDLLWQDAPFFLLTLRYSGDKLLEAVLDGKKIR